LIGYPEGKRVFETRNRKWKDNLKMYLKKIVMVLDGVVLLGIGISGGLLGV
jgi:hypothetical protein